MPADAGYLANLKSLKAKCDDVPVAPREAGGLTSLMSDVMAAPDEAPAVPAEVSPEALAAMTKEERTAYHKARRAATTAKPKAKAAATTKEERRKLQESQRKVKDDKKATADESAETLEELKLQGLTEEQAREMLAQIEKGATGDDEDDDDDGDETLLDSVRTWMEAHEQSETDEESLRDFNLKVRFQGHVESTPPDHLRAILQVLSSNMMAEDLNTAKQPGAVAGKLKPVFAKWGYMLGVLYQKCDVLTAADIVVGSVSDCVAEVSAVAFVGVLMAIREGVDAIEDEELLTGCRHLTTTSKVLEGFMEFLEDDDDDENSEDEA